MLIYIFIIDFNYPFKIVNIHLLLILNLLIFIYFSSLLRWLCLAYRNTLKIKSIVENKISVKNVSVMGFISGNLMVLFLHYCIEIQVQDVQNNEYSSASIPVAPLWKCLSQNYSQQFRPGEATHPGTCRAPEWSTHRPYLELKWPSPVKHPFSFMIWVHFTSSLEHRQQVIHDIWQKLQHTEKLKWIVISECS